jgi:phosphoglycerol transferase MdoB-like AlkP superfamily enzyme
MQFERAFAVYPESVKGLFATLCSRAPAFDVSAEAHAQATCASLVRALSGAGYKTALFHSGRFAYLGMDAVVARLGFDTAEDAGAIGGNVQSSFGVDEPSTVKRMLAWIDGTGRDKHFFITYLPVAGHHPYASVEPGPFGGRGDFSAYQNALYDGDRALGALVDGLRARGLDGKTLFVIVGDHGEAFGQHDGNYGHTLSIYDENVRVPLFFTVPGVTTEHLAVPNVASVLDVAPTILDLAGLAVPPAYEGQSLLIPRDRMALFYTDYSVGLLGLQDGCWKYHLDIEAPRSRLFDTCTDPGERVDRAATEPERVRAYGERLRGWASATRRAIVPRPW